MDFSQKRLRTLVRTHLEDGYLDGSCVPLALSMWQRPSLAARLLACRAVPLHGQYPALYCLLVALLRQYGAEVGEDVNGLLTACCRVRPLTVYELRQLPLFWKAAAHTVGGTVPPIDVRAAEEQYSIVERLLAEEPSGIYPHLSPEGRAECRRLVAEQAARQNRSETAVASDVSEQAFRGGTHTAALLLAKEQRRRDAAARALRTAAMCVAAAVAIPICVAADAAWALPPVWGVVLGVTLPLSRLVLRLCWPPCRHLPFGRITPPSGHRPATWREYTHIHPDDPQATLLSGGRYALLLTDNGACRTFYRRRELTPPTADSLLHPPGVFFTVTGDAAACLTASPFYREPTACTACFEEHCVRYHYSGAALDGTLTVSVHPSGYGDIRTVQLHNRTHRPLCLTLHVTLPYTGLRIPDARCGLVFIRGKQGQPLLGVGFAETADVTEDAHGLSLPVTVGAGKQVSYSLLTAVGSSREAVRCAFGALRENVRVCPEIGAVCTLPSAFAQRVLPHLIGPTDCGRPVRKALSQNRLPPAALRRFGIRPSLPYLLLTVHNAADTARILPYLHGIRTLYSVGIPCGAVILAPDTQTFRAVRHAVYHSDCAALIGRHGILRLLCAPSDEDRCLLTAFCAHDATHGSELGQLRTAFAPLFFTDGTLFVRVGNTVRTDGRVGVLHVTARGSTLHLHNPTAQTVCADVALLIPRVGQNAHIECTDSHVTLHTNGRRITVSEAGGISGFFCRRTAFYEGVWSAEPLPCPHPCAAVLCRRAVPAGKAVALHLKIRITPS